MSIYPLVLSPEVQAAISENRPVVALESTIIAHGMPFPQNIETARRVEAAVRAAGATPATCAILHGKMKAGLSLEEMEWLGQAGPQVPKASRRDLAYLLSQQKSGATTVAATMMIAHRAGIPIFATGGIGGVHRGAAQTMDISADLQELAHTPVAVVSAGVKSILDIGLTLEYLETMGVPVIGYKTNDFPAFYTQKSGFSVDFKIETPEAIAQMLRTHLDLQLRGGLLIAQPVPTAQQMDAILMEKTIAEALTEAEAAHIRGKAITPFLLAKISEITQGNSLQTNIALVLNNARLAAEVAVCLAHLPKINNFSM